MKYTYKGPTSGVTLIVNGKDKEILLHNGKQVDLPEDHDYTKTLIALDHLTKVDVGVSEPEKGGK